MVLCTRDLSATSHSCLVNPQRACARGLQYSLCLSVCLSVCVEKAPFSGLKLTSVYVLGDDLSPLNVALF